jgi:hypothetical protein
MSVSEAGPSMDKAVRGLFLRVREKLGQEGGVPRGQVVRFGDDVGPPTKAVVDAWVLVPRHWWISCPARHPGRIPRINTITN